MWPWRFQSTFRVYRDHEYNQWVLVSISFQKKKSRFKSVFNWRKSPIMSPLMEIISSRCSLDLYYRWIVVFLLPFHSILNTWARLSFSSYFYKLWRFQSALVAHAGWSRFNCEINLAYSLSSVILFDSTREVRHTLAETVGKKTIQLWKMYINKRKDAARQKETETQPLLEQTKLNVIHLHFSGVFWRGRVKLFMDFIVGVLDSLSFNYPFKASASSFHVFSLAFK